MAVSSSPSLALLANPDSGSGYSDTVATQLRSHGAEVSAFEFTPDPGRLDALVGGAVKDGATRVVVAGGDGSIAPAAKAAGTHGVPLAVIPAGTANDFARAHDIPAEIDVAAQLAVLGDSVMRHDLAYLADRPFVNVASAGLSAVAAREAGGLKARLGQLAYAAGALLAGISAQPLDCVVTCDEGEVHRGDAWQVTVACSGAFGGGAVVDADPTDGQLDVIVIPAGARVKLAWRAYGLLSGRIDRQREVGDLRCSKMTLDAGGEIELTVDGEMVEAGPAVFTIEPHAFEVVVG